MLKSDFQSDLQNGVTFDIFERPGTLPDGKDLLMMKANGFETSLVTSLSKFGESSSIECAFLCRSFLRYLQYLRCDRMK